MAVGPPVLIFEQDDKINIELDTKAPSKPNKTKLSTSEHS